MSRRLPPIVAAEVAELQRRYGPAEHREFALHMSPESLDYWLDKTDDKRAEVAMVIQRPSGGILLHTKDFYPAGAFRIPTGGIAPDEGVLHALHREVREETGLDADIVRFLALLEYRFFDSEREVPFATYLFLLRQAQGPVSPEDSGERISGFREIAPQELNRVADELATLQGRWADWGRFRALAHRVAAELLREHAGNTHAGEAPA